MTTQSYIHLFLFIFLFTSQSYAQIKNKRAEFDSKKIVEVKFGSSTWNKQPDVIDNGVVVLRDGNSNKTMQVMLEESAPDSGVFSGTYSISWGGSESVKPEVYVLNQSKLASETELKQILEDIKSGKLKRKPLFYKKNDVGVQVLEVFETKEQAQEAIALLNIQNQKGPSIDLSSVTSKEYSAAKAVMDGQELARFSLENDARKKEVQKRVIDRFRLEQTEKLRIEKYKKDFANLSEEVKKKNISEAEQFAEAALDFYKVGQYEKAEEQFRKAYVLYPTIDKYYFQYGLSLYKTGKYNAAIIVFNIIKENKEFEKEAYYYMALSQYTLREYETAYATFDILRKTKDVKLSPLSSFYMGLIFFEQKQYEKAKPHFESVLDLSKDPKLDQKAESYIDNINQLVSYSQLKQKKIFISASLGALYDSNVLEQSDSTGTGSATEQESLRYIIGLGSYYRPVFTKAYEFGVKFRTDYIYTQNSDATDYDPWSIQLNTPFTYKTALFEKSYKLDVKPGYELLYLGQEDTTGDPQKTLQGYYLDVGNTFIMKEDWFTTFTLSFRKDDFFEAGEEGRNANKLTFKWSNMFFTNALKTKGIIIDASYAKSDADDSTNSTNRYDLSSLYFAPVFNDKATFAGGLALYRLDEEGNESELNKTLNLTLTKPLTKEISGTILGTYVMNSSDADSSEYDKWTLGLVFTAEYGF